MNPKDRNVLNKMSPLLAVAIDETEKTYSFERDYNSGLSHKKNCVNTTYHRESSFIVWYTDGN